MSFTKFELNPRLLNSLDNLGFTTPTPIQEMAIPPLMQKEDVLAAAATGSGKTAAFLLPILHSIIDLPRGKTRALVLAPTRELAAQIVEHFNALAAGTPLKAAAVYGGVGAEPQKHAFERGVDLIAATPGRLLDHFQHPYAYLKYLEVLVLDEADRMLDMGFLPDVRRIIKALPVCQQTMLFSATMPQPIVELAGEMLKEPVALNIERKSAPAEGVKHTVFPVPHELKKNLLLQILQHDKAKSVLAFTRTKHRANRLADFLGKHDIPSDRIHGNRSQHQRTAALKGFKDGRFRVLVATDIAARGIDVEALDLVINFDVPNVPEDYIHRVGRTARAELTGDAYTFVSPAERNDLNAIESYVGKCFPREKIEGFDYSHSPSEKFEVPVGERIAAIRTRRAEERARARAKSEARGKRVGKPEARRSGNPETKEKRGTDEKSRPSKYKGKRPPLSSRQERPAAAASSKKHPRQNSKPASQQQDDSRHRHTQDQANLKGGYYSKEGSSGKPSPHGHKPRGKKRKPQEHYKHSLSNRGSK